MNSISPFLLHNDNTTGAVATGNSDTTISYLEKKLARTISYENRELSSYS